MRYISVCSGIEAATTAWHPLGWKAAAFSEIDTSPRRVLAYHYPDVPCHGDFTTIGENDYGSVELLVGGTPCQDFSIAGLRKGLAGERGNLTLEFIKLAQRKSPKWILWENVPGVLSQDGGRAFGAFLGGLAQCGYGFAYRVLDAQYFGVAQQRRRVFVVGYLGDWRPAAAVLFERESLRGNPPQSDEEREETTGTAGSPLASGKRVAGTILANCGTKQFLGNQEAFKGDHFIATKSYGIKAGNMSSNGWGVAEEKSHTINTGDRHAVAIVTTPHVFKVRGGCEGGGKGYLGKDNQAFTVSTGTDQTLAYRDVLRRFTPLEVERLFGFPDHYTAVDGMPDGKRYEMLGNSMAVPVMRWLGERIQMVEGLILAAAAAEPNNE